MISLPFSIGTPGSCNNIDHTLSRQVYILLFTSKVKRNGSSREHKGKILMRNSLIQV